MRCGHCDSTCSEIGGRFHYWADSRRGIHQGIKISATTKDGLPLCKDCFNEVFNALTRS